MYVSHPVRRMREDPLPDETASLVVELDDDADPDGLSDVVDSLDGAVERDLDFGCWLVSLPETAVAELCERVDAARIETADTLSLAVDPEATVEE